MERNPTSLPTDKPGEFYTPRAVVPPLAWFDGECPVVIEMDQLWSRLSDPSRQLESPVFFGDDVEYFFFTPGGWIELWASDEPRKFPKAYFNFTRQRVIAAANFIHLRNRLCELAGRVKGKTTPPSKVLQNMIRVATGHDIGADMAVASMESQRWKAVQLLSPSILSFLASLQPQPTSRKARTPDLKKRAAINAAFDAGITQPKKIQYFVKNLLGQTTKVSRNMIIDVRNGREAKKP